MINVQLKGIKRLRKDLGEREFRKRLRGAMREMVYTFYALYLYPYPPPSAANQKDPERGYYYRRHSGMFRYRKGDGTWHSGKSALSSPGWVRVTISGKVQNAWSVQGTPDGLLWAIQNVAVSKPAPGLKRRRSRKASALSLKAYAVYLYEQVPRWMREIGWKPWWELWADFAATGEHAKIFFRRILTGEGRALPRKRKIRKK